MCESKPSCRSSYNADVMTIRCTRKLRKHLDVGNVSGVSEAATTVLGDWYANLLYTRRHRLIICVSDRTLLAVFVAAKNPAGFISRMQTSARSLLWALGVPSHAIEREMREMEKVALGVATNQSVLGSMRELALQARFALEATIRTWIF